MDGAFFMEVGERQKNSATYGQQLLLGSLGKSIRK